MGEIISSILGVGLAMSPIVILLVETIKAPKVISNRWMPWVSVLVGIVISLYLGLVFPELGTLAQLSLSGMVAGTVASGIYDKINKDDSPPSIDVDIT